MQKQPDEILKAPYSRVLIPEEDGTFSAEMLEFPGCFAQGKTANEAFNNLEKAAKVWVEASLAQGLNIPPPALNYSYSGKIALRMPRSLHKRAAQMAARDATSLNQFLITAIASRIGAEEYHTYLLDNFKNLLGNAFANTIPIKSTLQQNVVTIALSQAIIYDIAFTQQETQGTIPHPLLVPELAGKSIGTVNNFKKGLISEETNTGR